MLNLEAGVEVVSDCRPTLARTGMSATDVRTAAVVGMIGLPLAAAGFVLSKKRLA